MQKSNIGPTVDKSADNNNNWPKAQAPAEAKSSDRRKKSTLSNIFANAQSTTFPEADDVVATSETPLLADSRNDYVDHSATTAHARQGRKPQEEYSRGGFSLRTFSKLAQSWGQENLTGRNIFNTCVVRPIGYLPSVFLGLLLNILDGLSYGMILFPLANPIFANLGSAGLSIFYVSCIVSQLVFSLGGSVFHSGVGSEMIEVVPFFHTMAATLVVEIGESNPKSVVATTITAYALSSIVTGLVFFTLGYLGLGSLVSFFPRHILVGCIGGVSWFLIVTGIEVTSKINGGISYNWETLKLLFNGITLLRWTLPLCLAFFLVAAQKYVHHPLLVPSYFIVVFVLFHMVVLVIPSLSYQEVRDAGWLFQSPSANEPWWYFYTLYDFKAVDYIALLRTVPAMFALTFFGILHVPINVPALAASTGEDDVNIDRELIAHGISNALSGMVGSIQNYLVYTNSVLFIRSGADSRLPGIMLAIATFGIMLVGPGVIGFIPVLVVGALIFLLGIELMIEALVDTWGRVSHFEYATIVVIVVTMGAIDFVIGIVVGILLACVTMVIEASQRSAIKATYTGAVARSTVRRNAVQQKFLIEVGDQIFVLKLTGNLFFGTIVTVEQKVRNLLDDAYFQEKPIRYLVLDMAGVTVIDFSAAEAFARMKRLLDTKAVFMLISGVTNDNPTLQSLRGVGLLENLHANPNCYMDEEVRFGYDNTSHDLEPVRLFSNLNSALEWSENQFLQDYYKRRDYYQQQAIAHKQNLLIPGTERTLDSFKNKDFASSPRVAFLQRVADKTALADPQVFNHTSRRQPMFKQPLPLLMQTFQGLTTKRETFWFAVSQFFRREEFKAGAVLYDMNSQTGGFYVVESGILRAYYEFEQGQLYETILAGTTCGELPFFSGTKRTATVKAETDVVVWNLDAEAWQRLVEKQVTGGSQTGGDNSEPDGREMALELYRIALKLTVERFMSVTAYILVSASR